MNMLRIQLDLPGKRVEELNRLMEKSHITTRKDFFNSALSLFAWVLSERSKGRIIASLDEQTGGYKELVMPFFAFISTEEEGSNNNHQDRTGEVLENLQPPEQIAIGGRRRKEDEQKARGKTRGVSQAATSIKGRR